MQNGFDIRKFWGAAAMVAATLLWGGSFSSQSYGMRTVPPLTFLMLRSVVAALALIPVAALFDRFGRGRVTLWGAAATKAERKLLFTGGVWCGVALGLASSFQQYGIKYTSAGKAGFLTALYIVIVPLLGIFFKRRATLAQWLATALALTGSYLLCGGLTRVGFGEIMLIIGAILFSGHILVIDRYAARCDCVRLSCIQFAVTSLITGAGSLAVKDPWVAADITGALPFWLYCGVFAGAAAFTLQMVAQKYLHPVTATLLMSLESVFAAIGGRIFLDERLTAVELTGCAVIFAAVILSQLPTRRATPRGE